MIAVADQKILIASANEDVKVYRIDDEGLNLV
jgi:hypothetical protein